MGGDLADAYGALDWANAQLETLEKRIKSLIARPPYDVIQEDHLEMGKTLFKLRPNDIEEDVLINGDVGAIINSVRSSLDLLAASLARRNGKTPNSKRHFPIRASGIDFFANEAVAEREKWLRPKDRLIIEALKPYKGGNDQLFALHQLDIIRKHERLVVTSINPASIIVDPAAHAAGFRFASAWPSLNDGSVIASCPINSPYRDFEIAFDITLNEPRLLPSQPIMPLLRDFRRMAELIVEMFDEP